MESLGGVAIEDTSGSMEGLHPIGRWHTGLEKKGVKDIIGGTNHTFGHAILLGCVRTRHTEGDAPFKKEQACGSVVKFVAIIALNALKRSPKLGGDVDDKVGDGRENTRFKT